jgi:hypothetical protein
VDVATNTITKTSIQKKKHFISLDDNEKHFISLDDNDDDHTLKFLKNNIDFILFYN